MIRRQANDGDILAIDHRDGHFDTGIQSSRDIHIGTLRSAWLGLPSDHGADVSRRMAIGSKALQRLGLISLGETVTLRIH